MHECVFCIAELIALFTLPFSFFLAAERHQSIQTIKATTTASISAGSANLKSVLDGKLAVISAATIHTCRQ